MRLSSVHYAGLATVLFENLTADFGFVIGRADKRYTLWKYAKENNSLTISYVQVLGENRTRVEMRFPGVYICEALRGEHRMVLTGRDGKSGGSKCKPESAPKTLADFIEMPFGDVRGMKISEVSSKTWCNLMNYDNKLTWTDAWGEEFDFEPLVLQKLEEHNCKNICNKWYTPEQMENKKLWMFLANDSLVPEEKSVYDEICQKLGLQKLMGRWFEPIAMDDEKPWVKTARQILPLIEKGEPFEFTAHYNGNGFFFGIPVDFLPEDKGETHTYYGSSYFLKVTNKKGVKVNKRVKGKTIEVLEYDILKDSENRPSVLVKKFNIK